MFHSAFTLKSKSLLRAIRTEVMVENIYTKQSLKLRAVWDTGAMRTTITEKFAKQIGCKTTDKVSMIGVGSQPKEVNIYDVNIIILPNKITIKKFSILSTESIANADMLIGMDIITLGDFVVTNKNKKTTVSFCIPSHKEIDLVEATKSSNSSFLKEIKNKFIHKQNKNST